MKKITLIVLATILGFTATGQTPTVKKLKQQIDQLLTGYVQYNRFMGNVLVTQGKKVIYEQSFGYADVAQHKKLQTKSVFDIASVSKPITAVAVMQLVEKGKVNLETPISSLLPEFIPEYASKITIRHLLNHSSGMQANIGQQDESGQGLVMPNAQALTLEKIYQKFKGSKLKFEPGKGYEYNNLGYVLLAHIIEKVSNQTYSDYLQTHIFKPAKMQNSSFTSNTETLYHLGLGTTNLTTYQDTVHASWLMGAGRICTTTNDLLHFMQALESGLLLKPSTVALLYNESQPMQVNDMKYGLGWVIDKKNKAVWRYHDGAYFGSAAFIGSMPEHYLKVIVLSNTSANPMDENFQGQHAFVKEIAEKIASLAQGEAVETLPLPTHSLNTSLLAKAYELDTNHKFEIEKAEDTYWLTTDHWSPFTYTFSKDSKDNSKASEIALTFAEAMKTQKLGGLASYANEEMKGFLGSEQGLSQLKGMWGYFASQAGEFKAYNIYKILGDEVKNVHIRFHFEKFDIGIVLSFNKEHQIQGLFMDDEVKTSHINKVKLIPIANDEFFIDGYSNGGMQDLKIKLKEDKLFLIDGTQKFEAQAISTF